MRESKIIAFCVIISLCLVCTLPASARTHENNDSGLETFLSVIKTWGTFLAKITGSYDSLKDIAIFSNIVRMWHDIVASNGFSVQRLFEAIMRWLGISIMMQQEERPQGSYSI